MNRILRTWIIIFVATLLISSCSKNPQSEPEQVDISMIGITQDMFDAKYGNPIVTKDYMIKVDAVPIQIDNEQNFDVAALNQMKSNKPDVILTSGLALPPLIQQGLILQIDEYANMNYEFMEGFAPSIIDKSRNDGGDGYLYGLPVTFSSDVLYYNKELFEKYGIPQPTNGMSWSEIVKLDQIILTSMADNGQITFGLLESGEKEPVAKLDRFIGEYAKSEGINDIDPTDHRIVVDTERWREIWQVMIEEYNTYRIFKQSHKTQNQLEYGDSVSSFMNQKSPLMLGGSFHWHSWIATNMLSFDWGVVTPPGRYNIYYQNNILAISSDTTKKEASWQLLQYLTSPDVTETLLSIVDDGSYPPKGYQGEFPARISLMEERDKTDLSAFYIQEPAIEGLYSSSDVIPAQFYIEYRECRIKHIQTVLDGKATVYEALVELQQEAQKILEKWID